MAAACVRAGRPVDAVRLVAVTKYSSLGAIRALADLGVEDLGENRPQQLLERRDALPAASWHLIGHLQRNKVRAVLGKVALIHSVDSLRLLERIDDIAQEMGLRPDVLLEVNVSGEASKDGIDPDLLQRVVEAIAGRKHVDVRGLMTMAPLSDNAEDARPHFRRLRELRDELARWFSGHSFCDLSMGMSGDFEVAIEEGATLVRVGSSLLAGVESATHE